MQFSDKERVALALAMRYPNQVITEADVNAEYNRLYEGATNEC